MNRLPRPILPAFAALSAILCIAATGLWVRSYWFADASDFDGKTSVGCVGGQLVISRETSSQRSDYIRGPGYHCTSAAAATNNVLPPKWQWAGFSFASISAKSLTLWDVRFPLWFVTLVTAIPPAAWAWRYRRHRRDATRGFDVQLNPETRTALSPKRMN